MRDKNGEEVKIGDWIKIEPGLCPRPFGEIISIDGESVTVRTPIVHTGKSEGIYYPSRDSHEIQKITQNEAILLLLENG